MGKIIDTTFCGADSSVVCVKNGNETIIIVNSKKEIDKKNEIDWTGTLFIPIIIVLVGTFISYFVNKEKTKKELKKLDIDSSKITEEIATIRQERELITGEKIKLFNEVEKMRTETEFLKNSFQPYVLTTLQETQREILKDKIAGLKELIVLSKEYYRFDNTYNNGERQINDVNEYYREIFSNFGKSGYAKFNVFVQNYEYLYPKSVGLEFKGVKALMDELYESNKRNNSIQEYELSNRDLEIIPQLESYFNRAIIAIRSDLQLDSTFIKEFMEKYNIKS
jgi:hypothetical protein